MPSDTATPAKQATCEDRVSEHMANRLKALAYLYGDPDLSDVETLRDMEVELGFDLTWVRDCVCTSPGDCAGTSLFWRTFEHKGPDAPETCPSCGGRDLETGDTRVSESEDDIREQIFEARAEYGLCFDYCPPDNRKPAEDDDDEEDPGYFRYQLSWGGPADEFRFFCGPGFGCYRVEYWFLDWFDGAHRTLHGADKKLLLSVFADFNECGSVANAYQEATE